MYSYMSTSEDFFNVFCQKVLKAFDTSGIPLNFLDLRIVLSYFEEIYPDHELLLLVDETLKPLTTTVFPASSNSSLESMIKRTLEACYPQGRAALFSAFATDFLMEDFRSSAREIKRFDLPLLSTPAAKCLILDICKQSGKSEMFESLLRSSGLTREEAVNSLASLGIASLPRCAEYLSKALNGKPKSFPHLINSVQSSVKSRYQSLVESWPLISASIKGVKLDLSQKLPGSQSTIRDLVYTGLLYGPELKKANEPVSVSLPPFFVMCSDGPDHSPELSSAHSDIANLIYFRPNNLWEEFVFRFIILRSYLFPHPLASSLLNLFGSEDDQMLSTPSFLGNLKVDLTKPFNRVFMTFDTPPSLEDLCKDPDLANHLWIPNSVREPGIDGLLFLRVQDPSSEEVRFVCVGLQCKYSNQKSKEKLCLSEVQTAQKDLLIKMESVGWKKENCGLVVLALCDLALDVVEVPELCMEGGGVAIVDSKSVEGWLGECMLTYIRGLHHQSISHLPRMNFEDK